VSSLLGLYGVLGIALIIELLVPVTLGAIFVIVVVATRSEPDPSGRRPVAVFMLATSFVTLFITLFSSLVAVAGLASLIGRRVREARGVHPVGDQVARLEAISLILAVTAGVALFLHVRRALAESRAEAAEAAKASEAEEAMVDERAHGPVVRVWQSYTAAVSFVCVMIAIFAIVVAVYQIFRVAGPGVFDPGSTSRVGAVRILLPSLYIAAAALAVMMRHQRARVRPLPPAPEAPFGADPGTGGGPGAFAEGATGTSLLLSDPGSAGPNPYGTTEH